MKQLPDDSTIEAFMALFRGRTDAWGSVHGKCNHENVSKEHYERHLRGQTSLGIYPLLDDGTCWFFAIDFDKHDSAAILRIRQEFRDNDIPVYLAASKSKGYHLYGFLEEPTPAKDIRRMCHGILTKLGIEAEIFPKQSKLDERITLGNFINLPCFGATRPFLKGDLTKVSLEEAIS